MSDNPTAPVFDDGKEADALRTIGEVSSALDIKQHVLRYWEQQFPMLKPLKRSGGRRYYRPDDIGLIQTIDRLVNAEGYTLKGAKRALQKGDVEPVSTPAAVATEPSSSAPSAAASGSDLPPDVLPQLRNIRAKLAAALEG